jgi:tetratricopeptide (TPR) repeat protein
MERFYAERLHERVEQLGHHALRAELWDKATEYFRQAGEKAFERFANREAASSFEQALIAIEHLPQTSQVVEQTLDLRLALRPCLTPLGDVKRLLENVRRAAPLATAVGDRRREALLNLYQATCLNNLGFPEDGYASAARGLEIAEALSDSLLQMSAQYFLGQSHNVRGAFREAIEAFERDVGMSVASLLEQTSERSGRDVLNARSAVFTFIFNTSDCSAAYCELGSFDIGMQRAKEAVRVAKVVGLTFLNALAGLQPGRVHLRKGELATAIPILERSIELTRAADFPLAFINAAPELGYAYNLSQRSRDAIPLLERAWSVAESGGSMHWGALSLIHLANAYSQIGDEAKAVATINRTLSIVRGRTFRAREAWAIYTLGNIVARASKADVTRAEDAIHSALALAHELRMRPLIGHCELALGDLLKKSGRCPQAAEHFAHAAATYGELEMQFWLEKVNIASK